MTAASLVAFLVAAIEAFPVMVTALVTLAVMVVVMIVMVVLMIVVVVMGMLVVMLMGMVMVVMMGVRVQGFFLFSVHGHLHMRARDPAFDGRLGFYVHILEAQAVHPIHKRLPVVRQFQQGGSQHIARRTHATFQIQCFHLSVQVAINH